MRTSQRDLVYLSRTEIYVNKLDFFYNSSAYESYDQETQLRKQELFWCVGKRVRKLSYQ